MEVDINKETVEEKIKLIELHVRKLKQSQKLSSAQLALDNNFDVAAWNLRCALESTFDICTHILSRIPGGKVGEYKKMALEMGKQKIVPMEFAETKLQEMAKYRNRLTHFYAEVTPEEMHGIIQKDLGDFDFFLKQIKKLLLKNG